MDDFLDTLPAERQAEILKVALAFGIQQHDPLFAVILALQFHHDLYKQIPKDIEQAGTEAAQLLNAAGESIKSDTDAARKALADNLQTFLKTAGPELTTAAQKGVVTALSSLDTAALVAKVAGRVADSVAIHKARKLAGLGLIVSGAAIVAALLAGGAIGRLLLPKIPEFERSASLYLQQLDCKKISVTDAVCRNPANGTAVQLKIPRG